MAALFELDTWREIFGRALEELGRAFAAFLPDLVAALVILAVGWFVARAAQLVAARLLHAAGLDRAAARLHFTDALERAGVRAAFSGLLAQLLFWLILLTFLFSAVETLGLSGVTATLDRLIAFIPSLIGAALIAVLGLLFVRFASSFVGSAAAAAGLPSALRLAQLTRGLGTLIVVILAVEHLGVATEVLVGPLTAATAAAGFAMALAFALGARPVVTHILAGHFLQQSLPRDTFVEIDGQRGVVERVGPTDTLLRDGERRFTLPNAQLLERMVIR